MAEAKTDNVPASHPDLQRQRQLRSVRQQDKLARRQSLDSSLGNKNPATRPKNNNQPTAARESTGQPQSAPDEQIMRRQLQTQLHAQRLQQAASQKQKAARQSAQKKTEKTD